MLLAYICPYDGQFSTSKTTLSHHYATEVALPSFNKSDKTHSNRSKQNWNEGNAFHRFHHWNVSCIISTATRCEWIGWVWHSPLVSCCQRWVKPWRKLPLTATGNGIWQRGFWLSPRQVFPFDSEKMPNKTQCNEYHLIVIFCNVYQNYMYNLKLWNITFSITKANIFQWNIILGYHRDLWKSVLWSYAMSVTHKRTTEATYY